MWKFAAARTVGSSHLKSGQVCQDRFAVWTDGENFVVAVADGAGSAPRSDEGAETAVTSAVTYLTKIIETAAQCDREAVLEAAKSAAAAVHELALANQNSVRDYACTLLVAALSRNGAAAGQIGDGLIAVRDEVEAGWSWVFWPHKGEYANMTRFLTDPDAMSQFEVTDLPNSVFEFAVTTDGLEALALNFTDQITHDPFFEGALSPLRLEDHVGEIRSLSEGLGAFLTSARVSDRTDDDLTLVIASRSPS